ncbi:AlbA family DNA-binding domain-containing protein [Modestobacter sp. VKM Ac-2978]|uniref:AlbA family DNA-binding domain-containing protein n=1 Tax=Modestobacter sp. VKM Ac-2978 TaxID=3004132 RepID=UPI0022AA6197|nr:ATP-binding protein [Modestobacter sp. VKM Ac-2978]MCZ2849023.1 ATP-binding protein [Modestobacter sp. VKM Ac-2978]
MTTSSSFYLGPRKSRLPVKTWDDVVAAAAAGVLDENHWVELKQAVPAANKPANLELARDLASLSVDGGVFIVGVEDAGGAAGAVVGTPLEGLRTRITQVASMRIDPPLSVAFDVFPKPGDPDVGVLVVSVPASEGAPHQVDQRYWGRNDQGKRALGNDEVRRLLADRQARSDGFVDRLREVSVRLDGENLSDRGRLFLLLEPGAESGQPVTDLLAGKILLQVAGEARLFEPQWYPSLYSIHNNLAHPDGLAATSWLPDDGPSNKDPLSILLTDEGSLLMACPAVQLYGREVDAPAVVVTGHVLETLHSAVALAAYVANEYTGYQGIWRGGVLVTGLRGLLPSQAYNEMTFQRFAPYPVDEYVMTTDTSTREMTEATSVVVERLAKRLLRGLGVVNRFLPYSDPSDIARRL